MIRDFRAYRCPNEKIEIFLGPGVILKAVGFDMVCDGLVDAKIVRLWYGHMKKEERTVVWFHRCWVSQVLITQRWPPSTLTVSGLGQTRAMIHT